MEKTYFTIEQFEERITKFTNSSGYDVIASLIPIKPKRKYIDVILIQKEQYNVCDFPVDLTKLSFRFLKNPMPAHGENDE